MLSSFSIQCALCQRFFFLNQMWCSLPHVSEDVTNASLILNGIYRYHSFKERRTKIAVTNTFLFQRYPCNVSTNSGSNFISTRAPLHHSRNCDARQCILLTLLTVYRRLHHSDRDCDQNECVNISLYLSDQELMLSFRCHEHSLNASVGLLPHRRCLHRCRLPLHPLPPPWCLFVHCFFHMCYVMAGL